MKKDQEKSHNDDAITVGMDDEEIYIVELKT